MMIQRVPFSQSVQHNQHHSQVGIVAARKAALEKNLERQERPPTDVLGQFKKVNNAAVSEIQALQAQLDRERAEKKALVEASSAAQHEAKRWEKEAKAQQAVAEQATHRSAKAFGRAKYGDLRDERLARQSSQIERARQAQAVGSRNRYRKATVTEEYLQQRRIPNLHAPSTPSREFPGPRSAATREYLKFKSMSQAPSEAAAGGSVTPGSRHHRGGSVTPWRMTTPRTQVTSVQRMGSVSRDSWTPANSELARNKCMAYGLLLTSKSGVEASEALPRKEGMPVCAGYKKLGYCAAWETRGRCNFDHPPLSECQECSTPSQTGDKVMVIRDNII